MAPIDAAAARERFAAARVARLATADGDGRPHVVPIVFAVARACDRGGDRDGHGDGDVIYSAVDAKPKRSMALRRLANVAANPAVSVLADHYEEDWSALWWVRADGRGRLLDPDGDAPREAAEARTAIGLLAARYPQQRATGAVLAVDVVRWSGWSAS